jgi:Cupredoxin-like domain
MRRQSGDGDHTASRETLMPQALKISRAMVLGIAIGIGACHAASAQETMLQITVQNHQFSPSELRAPANRPIVIVIRNNDVTAMEFESVSLRVEKVVAAKSQASVRVRALSPGRYEFFDDFNQSTRGALTVQ